MQLLTENNNELAVSTTTKYRSYLPQTSVLSLLSQLLERVRQWPAAWPWNPRPILAIIQGSVGMPTTATTLSFAMEA